MTVFKTIWKIVAKNKGTIILYTVLLIVFGGLNFASQESTTSFTATKPDIAVVNFDKDSKLTYDFIDYLNKNTNIKQVENKEDTLNDALFYRDVNFIIYIPENFTEDIMSSKNPEIEIKQTNDYPAALAQNYISKYIKLANIYSTMTTDEEELIEKINESLKVESEISVTSKLDTSGLNRLSGYFNFLNYSLLAAVVYVICLILSTFKGKMVNKRNNISSTSYRKINFNLMLSTSLLTFIFWIFYIILSIILLGNIIFTMHGLLYIFNSLIFTICALSIALLIGNLVTNRNAISGIINVLAVGSSFLCGSFVPQEFLPSGVLKIAHILPSYWYIKSNDFLKTVEEINFNNLTPYFNNLIVIIIFTLVFIITTNIITRIKRKTS